MSSGIPVPKLEQSLSSVRAYLYRTVARCSGMKLEDVSDETRLGPAAFDAVPVLAFKLGVMVVGDTEMTIGELLKELKLK